MDLKELASAIEQISEEKGIPFQKIIESVETALAAAYKKEYGRKGQIIKAKFDPKTGEVKFWQVKLVVDKDMIYSEDELEKMKQAEKEKTESFSEEEGEKIRFNPERHIMLEEAEEIKENAVPGEEIEIPLEEENNYGRIAAQTAKQVILQKIREAEREMILQEYKSKEGEIVSGIIQRIEGGNVLVDLGKTVGIMPREEQVPGENYVTGQRFKFYLLEVQETPRGSVVLLSRAYPKLLSKLFELEAPEISQGEVVIRSIAREAGSRSKIAVEAKEEGVDPIGSTVGQKGTRVMAVINELRGEKVDIVEYSDDPEKFIANALSPAKVLEVKLMDKNRALCIVPEDQLSLAIGKDGQNVRLAAKLTGWKIDVRTSDGKSIEEISKEEDKDESDSAGGEENKNENKDNENQIEKEDIAEEGETNESNQEEISAERERQEEESAEIKEENIEGENKEPEKEEK